MCTRRITADLCKQGYYCLENTGYNIQPCPTGTFGAREGLELETECSNCTGGYYCQETGLSKPSGGCEQGHWCQYGVNTKAPTGSGHTGVGDVCFAGHECPENTSYPIPCKNGYYASTTGMAACEKCPAGKWK